MKKRIKNIVLAAVIIISAVVPNSSLAYTRPNNFENLKGTARIEGIKRFQAELNVPTTGVIDAMTKKVLHTENIRVRDYVKPPTNGNWITVNLTNRILTMYKGNEVLYKFPVAVGASATPTPAVKGKIMNKHVNPAWGGMGGKYKATSPDDPYNPLGERWMGLNLGKYSGYGIHGTIKPHQIGMYVSNGCIRMFNHDIENYIFPASKVGMPVYIGRNEELNSWGVYQYFEEIDPNAAPKDTPQKPVVEHYETEDLYEY